jgi:hypothetical protein
MIDLNQKCRYAAAARRIALGVRQAWRGTRALGWRAGALPSRRAPAQLLVEARLSHERTLSPWDVGEHQGCGQAAGEKDGLDCRHGWHAVQQTTRFGPRNHGGEQFSKRTRSFAKTVDCAGSQTARCRAEERT